MSQSLPFEHIARRLRPELRAAINNRPQQVEAVVALMKRLSES